MHDDMTGGSKGSKAHAHTCLGCFNLRGAADGRRRQPAATVQQPNTGLSSSTNAAACLLHHLRPMNLRGSDSITPQNALALFEAFRSRAVF